MMKTSSRKAKGRRLQDKVRQMLIDYLDISPDNIRTAIMGEKGRDITIYGKDKELFNFAIECKNQERLNIWDAIKQADDNAGDDVPIVIIKRNRSKIYAVLEFEELLKIIRKSNGR